MSAVDFKSLREQLGLSQSAFASKFNIPVANIQHWEQGYRIPPPYVFDLIQKVVEQERQTEIFKRLVLIVVDDKGTRYLVDKNRDDDFCFEVTEIYKVKGYGFIARGKVLSGMAFEGSRLYRNEDGSDVLKLNVFLEKSSVTRLCSGWVFAGDEIDIRLPFPDKANVEVGDKLYQLRHYFRP